MTTANLSSSKQTQDTENSAPTLSAMNLEYYKWAKNVTIFIHGFNVEMGQSPQHGDIINPQNDDNGTGDINWFLHIEDALNRATGQFDGSDYRKYQRCLHVRWKGDIKPLAAIRFDEARDNADIAGVRLAPTLKQLHEAGISINIIGHSLGNRVLLRALDFLGYNGMKNVIDHIFLWEAAVPNNSLSPTRDSDFPHAAEMAKKITVLFSKNDDVLSGWYVKDQSLLAVNYENMKKDFSRDPKTINVLQHNINNALKPALGLAGPDLTDPFVRDLWQRKKLTLADMTPWSQGHSYMKTPSADVMKYGYETWIMNKKQGMGSFGNYDPSKFPDYPAYVVEPDGTVVFVSDQGEQSRKDGK